MFTNVTSPATSSNCFLQIIVHHFLDVLHKDTNIRTFYSLYALYNIMRYSSQDIRSIPSLAYWVAEQALLTGVQSSCSEQVFWTDVLSSFYEQVFWRPVLSRCSEQMFWTLMHAKVLSAKLHDLRWSLQSVSDSSNPRRTASASLLRQRPTRNFRLFRRRSSLMKFNIKHLKTNAQMFSSLFQIFIPCTHLITVCA